MREGSGMGLGVGVSKGWKGIDGWQGGSFGGAPGVGGLEYGGGCPQG